MEHLQEILCAVRKYVTVTFLPPRNMLRMSYCEFWKLVAIAFQKQVARETHYRCTGEHVAEPAGSTPRKHIAGTL